jgi:hypothetical protein
MADMGSSPRVAAQRCCFALVGLSWYVSEGSEPWSLEGQNNESSAGLNE